MENVTSVSSLKEGIYLLEADKADKWRQVRDLGSYTLELIRPANILQSTVTGIATSPRLLDNIVNTAVGLATGFISKRLFIGSSGSPIRKLLGSVVQLGMTAAATQNSNFIQSFGRFALQRIFFKHGLNTENRGG